MSPLPVPKPSTAGEGKVAIIKTVVSFANLRDGPGVEYTDIGDILNQSQVTYYPDSLTDTGWIWVEQYQAAGWMSTTVVEFEDLVVTPPPDYPETPYDGQIGIWHWKGQSIPENTLQEIAVNLKGLAPNVKQIWVKVGDGNTWQGEFDDSLMAVNGPDDVDAWVRVLGQHGLEFHAWTVPKGEDIDGEADIIIQTAQRPGVKSLILDVEPFEHYWQTGKDPIRPLMLKVRQALGGAFHIGLSVDPRRQHYDRIYPEEWFPFVNSVHPMCYWKSFQRPVSDVIEEAYRVWGNYGRAIIPILQGDAPVQEQQEAAAIATQVYRAKGLSWWRYGVIGIWDAVNTPIVIDSPPTDNPVEQPPPGTRYGNEQIIFAGQNGYNSGSYTGQDEFNQFSGTFGWDAYYTTTETYTSKVWAEWKTDLEESGNYQISVFVPSRHATTRKARYKIHGIRGTTTEVIVDINQSNHRNEWVPLGVFDLVKGAPNAGKVFLNDVTTESDKEIAFDAVRLRQIITLTDDPGTPPNIIVADGYDSPVGTEVERESTELWPPDWRDASPFGRLYFVGTYREAYHTGADLNWGAPYEDQGLPTYACASGVVIVVARLNVWGNVIIIKHDPLKSPTGRVIYSRYAHIQNMIVQAGDRVNRGDQIAEIGNAFGTLVPHLHFDLSPTTKLETNPADWPGRDATRLFRDYIDPLDFITRNRL